MIHDRKEKIWQYTTTVTGLQAGTDYVLTVDSNFLGKFGGSSFERYFRTRGKSTATVNISDSMSKTEVREHCKDEKPNACKNFYRTKCNSPKNAVFVKTNCKETCGFCDIEASAGKRKISSTKSTVGPKTVIATTACVDEKPKKCKLYGKARCFRLKFKDMMGDFCKKTCGKCGDKNTESDEIKDSRPKFCQSRGVKACTGKAMKRTCRKTCQNA